MGCKSKILICAYPGDELRGASTIFGSVDKFVFHYYKSPEGHRTKPSGNSIVIIETDRAPAIPVWRCGVMLQEVLESLINPEIDEIYVPSVFEPDPRRQEVARVCHALWVKHNYELEYVDYSVEGVQPNSNRVKLSDTDKNNREVYLRKMYGKRVTTSFRPFEEFSRRKIDVESDIFTA